MKNYLTLPITYKALIYSSFGRPSEVLKVTHLEMPHPSGDEVLVKMLKASVNPSDLLTIRGTYASRTQLPKIAGFEGVGIVQEVGDPDNDNLIGKRVLALKGRGTWQEYNIIPACEAVLVPEEISNNLAAGLYINPLTCYLMLKEKLNAHEGNTVLINAGNSACG